MRRDEFDIMKGILIIFVVMGHASAGIPYLNVYWFHMPLFFMITGYLTKRWLSFADLFRLPDNGFTRKILIDRFKLISKLIIPYFAYCILFYFIFYPEPIIKNIVRVIYAGSNNVTIYSYPFWFVNALLVAKLLYGSIKVSRYAPVFILICWALVHLNIFCNYIPVPLPWCIDNALAALVYIYIGDTLKSYKFEKWHLIALIFAPLFIWANSRFNWEYSLDMKSMKFNFPILDIIVPLLFVPWMYGIAFIIKRVPCLSKILVYVGTASITIFFVHAAIVNITEDYVTPWVRVACAIGVSLLVHYICCKFRITRKLFLGQSY